LARQLARHGLAVSGGLLAVVLAQSAASAGVPTAVMSSTINAATVFAAGQAAAGVVATDVAALAEGVLKAMFLNKFRGVLVALVLVVAVLAGGSSSLLPTHAGEKKTELIIPLKTEVTSKTEEKDFNKIILAMEARMWEGHIKGDAGALKKIYADDYVAFSERGRSDKPANIAVLKAVRTGKVTFQDVEIVRVNKDTAIVTYRADRTAVTPGGRFLFERRNCRISNTWVRREGRWVVVFCQETQLPTVHRGARR